MAKRQNDKTNGPQALHWKLNIRQYEPHKQTKEKEKCVTDFKLILLV
jgi:hypothetical protein